MWLFIFTCFITYVHNTYASYNANIFKVETWVNVATVVKPFLPSASRIHYFQFTFHVRNYKHSETQFAWVNVISFTVPLLKKRLKARVQRGPRISTLLEARKGSQKFNILDESNVCFLLSTSNHTTNIKHVVPSILSSLQFLRKTSENSLEMKKKKILHACPHWLQWRQKLRCLICDGKLSRQIRIQLERSTVVLNRESCWVNASRSFETWWFD